MKKPSIDSLLPIGVIILLVGVVALGVWVMFGGENSPFPNPSHQGRGNTNDSSPLRGEDTGGGEIASATFDQPEENFTFNYPEKFQVTTQPLDYARGKKILVESNEPKKGFEITILPFDEEGVLTPERIRADLPEMVMENIRNANIANGDNANATNVLAFNSTDENIGRTFEIWFVYDGNLYQALTYPEFAEEMEEILKTWRFK